MRGSGVRDCSRAGARILTHVERFDIAVRQPALVQMLRGQNHLPRHRAHGVQAGSLLLKDLQKVAVGLVHHESALPEGDARRQMLLDKLVQSAFEVLNRPLEIIVGRSRERLHDKS